MKLFPGSTQPQEIVENQEHRTTYDDSAHRFECLISFGRRPGDCDNLKRLEILSLSPHCDCWLWLEHACVMIPRPKGTSSFTGTMSQEGTVPAVAAKIRLGGGLQRWSPLQGKILVALLSLPTEPTCKHRAELNLSWSRINVQLF